MELIVTQGSGEAYERLIPKLATAKSVFLATYNLGDLTKQLFDCPADCHVEVFTNVPNRYGSYWGSGPRKRAKSTISKYMAMLDAEKFKCNLEAYFALGNHAKLLVIDDAMAYMGSANFGDALSPHLEAGVISEDKEFIATLKDQVRGELLEHESTFPYVRGPAKRLGQGLVRLHEGLEALLERLDDQLFEDLYTFAGDDRRVFRPSMSGSYTWLSNALNDWYGSVEECLGDHRERLNEWFSGAHAEKVEAFDSLSSISDSILDLPPEIQALADYDYSDRQMSKYEDNWIIESVDEALAAGEAAISEEFDEITSALEPKYLPWRATTGQSWKAGVRACLMALKAVAKAEGLDNT